MVVLGEQDLGLYQRGGPWLAFRTFLVTRGYLGVGQEDISFLEADDVRLDEGPGDLVHQVGGGDVDPLQGTVVGLDELKVFLVDLEPRDDLDL